MNKLYHWKLYPQWLMIIQCVSTMQLLFDNCFTGLNELNEIQLRELLDEGNEEGKWLPWSQWWCLMFISWRFSCCWCVCSLYRVVSVIAANYVTCWTKKHERSFIEAWVALVSCFLQNAEIMVIASSSKNMECVEKRTTLVSSSTLQNIAGRRVNIVSQSSGLNGHILRY